MLIAWIWVQFSLRNHIFIFFREKDTLPFSLKKNAHQRKYAQIDAKHYFAHWNELLYYLLGLLCAIYVLSIYKLFYFPEWDGSTFSNKEFFRHPNWPPGWYCKVGTCSSIVPWIHDINMTGIQIWSHTNLLYSSHTDDNIFHSGRQRLHECYPSLPLYYILDIDDTEATSIS